MSCSSAIGRKDTLSACPSPLPSDRVARPTSSCSVPAPPVSARHFDSRESGYAVTVLERADHVGGLAASFEVAGQRVDHGSHRLHPSTPAPIMAVLRDLLGTDLQQRPRHGRIRMAERFVVFPPNPTDLVRRLPPTLSMRLALRHGDEPDAHAARTRPPDTFADPFARRSARR